MKILVTGAHGFLGKAVCAELRDKGHSPLHFDTTNGYDIREYSMVWNSCNKTDGVIHLAGVLGTGELFENPDLAIDVNVRGAVNVFRACAALKIPLVGIQMPEVWPNVYQATKTCARTLATAWHLNYDLKCSFVRAYNVFGPGQKVKGVQKILPTFATRAWRDLPLPIWGDGSQTVDLVHVSDVARMLVQALEFHDDQTFDAGTGIPTSVQDVAEEVLAHTESRAGIEYLPMRPGELPGKVVASGEGWEILGWRPKFDFGQLYEAIDWYREERP